MALGYITTLRNTRLNDIITAIGSDGLLRVYSGTQPATGGAETTLLAELALSSTAAPTASGGVLTFSAISDDASANATGTPTWARLCTSAGDAVVDMTAGIGSGDLNFNGGIIIATSVSVTELIITAGNP